MQAFAVAGRTANVLLWRAEIQRFGGRHWPLWAFGRLQSPTESEPISACAVSIPFL